LPPGIRKSLSLVAHPRFIGAVLHHRVAAGTEHLAAIRYCAANTLLDIGANKGQFSLAFRTASPNATIVAFEPLPEAADVYERLFARSSRISLQRVALAEHEGTAQFYVADRADSSSLLTPGKGQERAFGVRVARTIEVPVKRLDECVDVSSLIPPVFLKVDVQGGELGVFECCDSLAAIDFIYVELSFVQLYDGQPLFREINSYLEGRGFTIAGIFNQVMTAEFGPTQVDVLFRRC
jgi:FkbM family methyltransferase